MRRVLRAAGVFAVGLIFMAPVARASDARLDAADLSVTLMSPFCPGLLLTNCPSSDAQLLRREIEERFAKGQSRDAIERDLVSRYGAAIRAVPPAHGVGLLAWLLPAAAAALTLGVAIAAVRRAVMHEAAPASETIDNPSLAAQLDEALHRLD